MTLFQTSMRDPRSLEPFPKNPRVHSRRQLAQLRRSIEEHGFYAPVVIDEHDTILIGHTRTEVAVEIGLGAIPCCVLGQLNNEPQKRALVLADNKIALNATWDQRKVLPSSRRSRRSIAISISI